MIALWLACFDEPAIEVKTDPAALAKHVPVPPGWDTVRWAGRPLGSPGLGPTDLVVVAVFPDADTSSLERIGDRPVLTDVVLAGVLGLPDELAGERFEPAALTTPMWHASYISQGEHGVVVQWSSR